jgi:predicted ribosomally synthesized peptide with nif11-like leader
MKEFTGSTAAKHFKQREVFAMGIDEFAEKIRSDEAFAKKYEALTSLDDVLAQAKVDGYSATKEEAMKYIEKTKKSLEGHGNLSDDELENAAGGRHILCGGLCSMPGKKNEK